MIHIPIPYSFLFLHSISITNSLLITYYLNLWFMIYSIHIWTLSNQPTVSSISSHYSDSYLITQTPSLSIHSTNPSDSSSILSISHLFLIIIVYHSKYHQLCLNTISSIIKCLTHSIIHILSLSSLINPFIILNSIIILLNLSLSSLINQSIIILYSTILHTYYHSKSNYYILLYSDILSTLLIYSSDYLWFHSIS